MRYYVDSYHVEDFGYGQPDAVRYFIREGAFYMYPLNPRYLYCDAIRGYIPEAVQVSPGFESIKPCDNNAQSVKDDTLSYLITLDGETEWIPIEKEKLTDWEYNPVQLTFNMKTGLISGFCNYPGSGFHPEIGETYKMRTGELVRVTSCSDTVEKYSSGDTGICVSYYGELV